MKYGRQMNFTSHQVKKIYRELKTNPLKYPNLKLCNTPGCRGGFRIDNSNGKVENCPRCQGYGFFRKD